MYKRLYSLTETTNVCIPTVVNKSTNHKRLSVYVLQVYTKSNQKKLSHYDIERKVRC